MSYENQLDSKPQGKKIGIMGGTFDPVHYGHLVLAEEARNRLDLDEVIFIPVGRAPHKINEQVTDPETRFKMVELAISDNPHFKASKMEIEKSQTSYTVHTLRHFKELEGTHAELYFITGADTLLDLHNWYAFEEVLSLCTFVGATRPGYVSEALLQEAKRLRETYQASIELIAIPGLSISSTEIRERVASHVTIRYLVPDRVLDFIMREKVYG